MPTSTKKDEVIILGDDDLLSDTSEELLSMQHHQHQKKSSSEITTTTEKLEIDDILRLFLLCAFQSLGLEHDEESSSSRHHRIQLLSNKKTKQSGKRRKRQDSDDDDDDDVDSSEVDSSSSLSESEINDHQISDNNNKKIISQMKNLDKKCAAMERWVETQLNMIRENAEENLLVAKTTTSDKEETEKRNSSVWSWNLEPLLSMIIGDGHQQKQQSKQQMKKKDLSIEELTRIVGPNTLLNNNTNNTEVETKNHHHYRQIEIQSWINAFGEWLNEEVITSLNSNNKKDAQKFEGFSAFLESSSKTLGVNNTQAKRGKNNKSHLHEDDQQEEESQSSLLLTRAQILMIVMMQFPVDQIVCTKNKNNNKKKQEQQETILTRTECVDAIIGSVFCVVENENGRANVLLPEAEVVEIDD